jgi:hypothetical protein
VFERAKLLGLGSECRTRKELNRKLKAEQEKFLQQLYAKRDKGPTSEKDLLKVPLLRA